MWAFDVASGKVERTGRNGIAPVRYASGGKHAACPAGWPEKEEGWLRVFALAEGYPTTPVGEFWLVKYLRPTGDGAFYFDVRYKNLSSGGWRYDPRTGKGKELWRMDKSKGVVTGGASCPELMVSVSTDYRYVTTVTDLRTWKALKIDNSARYKAEWLSGSSGPGGEKLGEKPEDDKPEGAVTSHAAPPEKTAAPEPRGAPELAPATLALAAALAALALWARRLMRASPPPA